jgi:hypothetical protein
MGYNWKKCTVCAVSGWHPTLNCCFKWQGNLFLHHHCTQSLGWERQMPLSCTWSWREHCLQQRCFIIARAAVYTAPSIVYQIWKLHTNTRMGGPLCNVSRPRGSPSFRVARMSHHNDSTDHCKWSLIWDYAPMMLYQNHVSNVDYWNTPLQSHIFLTICWQSWYDMKKFLVQLTKANIHFTFSKELRWQRSPHSFTPDCS